MLDAASVAVDADVSLHAFFTVGPLPSPLFWFDVCSVTGSAGPASLTGALALEPHPDNPSFLSADQVGNLSASISGLALDLGALCGVPIVGQALLALEAPISREAERILEGSLNDRSSGDTVVANSLEAALFEVAIAGSVFRSTGVLAVDAPMSSIAETVEGVTASIDVNIRNVTTVPGAPAQGASFFVEGTPPVFELVTPHGLDYEAAASVHTGALNQSLRAATQLGVFNYEAGKVDLSQLDVCLPDLASPGDCLGGVVGFDSSLLATLVPQFGALPAGTPLEVIVAPTLAPVVAMNPDPSQSDPNPIHAHAAQHIVAVVEPLATGGTTTWLRVSVDLKAGLAIGAGPTPGHLAASIDPSAAGYVSSLVTLSHGFATWPDDDALALLLNLLGAAYVVPELLETLEQDPLPTIDLPALTEIPGLQPTAFDVVLVETEIVEDFVTVYLDMDLRE